ncbi:ankyrin repeat domain-containing protein [Pseudomonas oryzae]|uniref:Ankyrin repeat-containing protein n=1 Tax=Pseudomonas oryzae TaxID=1392877 RepID=A0A1H1XZ51_9PSED|nr:ankyrin repeat domain-containing protein [Pseudomonas oryzae]SDT14462.1 Ankyrin repeat-containing protein [Pseudomonas oryzae]
MALAPRVPFQCLSAAEAAALVRAEPDLVLFDVRDRHSYQQEHLDGAMHLTEDRVPLWVARLEKSAALLVYCYHGNASKTFAQMFSDFRFARVYSVDGGYRPLASALAAPAEEAPSDSPSAVLAGFLADWGYPAGGLDTRGAHGLTPLMRAALLGRREIVQELLALGADLQARNDDGNTALWLACVSRDAGLVQDLIEAGSELDSRNDAGATALMYTASSDRAELLALLLAAGADPQLRNCDDLRAVELAASRDCLRLLRHTAT